jgi:putative transposase
LDFLAGLQSQEVNMKKSRFSESQIVAILKEAQGMPVDEVIRKNGISRATFYLWRSRYGGLEVSELKRTKELEGELGKLKQMYAELAIENAAIKDVLSRKW